MDDTLYAKCSCERCGNHISFPVDRADTSVACPHCNELTQLTLVASAPVSSPDRPSAAEIVNAFGPPLARAPVSLFYKAGLVLVALTMVLLPLAYCAMIGAAAWGVYYYATHFGFLLSPGGLGGRGYILKLLLYLTPLFVGVILVVFMVKPLFARRPKRAQPLALDPAINSTLYAFIARICDTVGAPMPQRIDLDCELNASASFRRGARSLFQNDLVLTIGLPLVAALNLREFAGIVAHEFGHFTQSFGMRLSYLIRSINAWFARVVFERDACDAWLVEVVEESGDARVMLIVWCAQAGVGISRGFLLLLMYLGHGISCFLLRQMEHDADGYQIRLAGSAVAERTTIRLDVLGEAMRRSYKELRSTWNTSRKLPDNFPMFLVHHETALPPQLKAKIEDTAGLSRTGVFGTHPSDGDRIRRARLADEPGCFHLDQPATVLFSSFEIVAKQITMLHYNDDIGLRCDASNLRSMEFYAKPTAA